MTARPAIVQFNLSPTLGGAEVFTAFMGRALAARGWTTRTLVDAGATYWNDLDTGGVAPIRAANAAAAAATLVPGEIALVHSPLPAQVLQALCARGPVMGLAHQILHDASRPAYYDHADLLFGVSQHVLVTLRERGLTNVHPDPLLGIGEIHRQHAQATPSLGPLCEWDARKLRDRVLSLGERAGGRFASQPSYARRTGLTLGIVSRIAPAKQFPALFDILAPIISAQKHVNLEVFGVAVGYKALREFREALRPLGTRARLWGYQRDVAAAYRSIDYLVTGLPEREALGLNVIEAGLCGTPVLAVDASPFIETVRDGVNGFLYTDPRKDQGRHFARLLAEIADGTRKPDMAHAAAHLASFSFANFADRVDAAMRAAVQHGAGERKPTTA